MKRYLTILFFFLLSLTLSAQQPKMNVTGFRQSSEQTANLAGTMVPDNDGKPCALLRVQTTQKGFNWQFGQFNAVKVDESHTAEIWVYVPYGVKRCTIRHPQLGTCEYSFPIAIESARTYLMDLAAASVHVIVDAVPTKQFLVFKLTPADAVVELNGQMLDVSEGEAQKFVDFGTYRYKVQAADYYPAEGTVAVDDPNNKKELNIVLKPAFGYLTLTETETSKGASVFIDDKFIGKVPCKSGALTKGNHTVKCSHPMYKPLVKTVVIPDEGKSADMSVELERNYAEVSVVLMDGAELWIDGEKKGVGNWSGKVGCGGHLFEVRREGYRSKSLSKDIALEPIKQSFTMPDPDPVYGFAVITSTPSSSTIRIDGKVVGKSPLQQKLLIGRHQIELSNDGYTTQTKEITITEGGSAELKVALQKGPAVVTAPSKSLTTSLASDGKINGYEYVDLGLSVKWATCNIGASKPEEYGRYFAWGDVVGQTWNGSKWSNGGFNNEPKCEKDSNGNLLPEYDAAHKNWGGSWRMPTKAECTELIRNCNSEWTTVNGVKGRKFISKKPGYTGKSIFLPAAGYGHVSYLSDASSYGYFWSSSFYYDNLAWYRLFGSDYVNICFSYRNRGRSIRPVSE